MDVKERYRQDYRFHVVVDWACVLMARHDFTPEDLEDMVRLAIEIEGRRRVYERGRSGILREVVIGEEILVGEEF